MRWNCALMLALSLCSAPLQARVFAPKDVFQLEWADEPSFAPNGQEIAFTRAGLDIQTDRRVSTIWRVQLPDGALRPWITEGNPRAAQYAPDGKSLAFLQAGKLMLRWRDGETSISLAKHAEGVSAFAFSPDSQQIAFSMFVARPGPTGAVMPEKPKNADWGAPVKVIDRLRHRADGGGSLEVGERHLFVVPIAGGSARQLSSGEFDHGSFAWRADSKALFVSSNRAKDAEYDPIDSEIYALNLTGEYQALTDRDGPDQLLDASRDGRYLAYSGFDDRKQFSQVSKLYLLDLKTKQSRVLTQTLDRSIDVARFSADSKTLYVQYDDRGETRVSEINLKSAGLHQRVITGGTDIGRPYGGGSFAVDAKGRIAYSAARLDAPADLALQAPNAQVRRLTTLNTDALAGITLGVVEEQVVASSFDGKSIQGWIIKPPQFDAKKRYPLVLEIHGGPVQNYGPRFSPELQLYAAAGYVVLYVNPRGSDSYGEAFSNAIHHDYPNHDYDDLMSHIDAMVAKDYIDKDRLFVTGGSGGGVLTAWIVGHTDRFKAAVVAKPVINWMSFVLTSDGLSLFHQYWFPGLPWEHSEHYLKRSPLMHVGKVKTPTMVIVGDADLRTPVSESEQYYHALKLRKVPTQLVLIPGASHSISARPSHLIAQVLNTIAWFEKRHDAKAIADPKK
jgi:dipeptidyl aminopeptidase/acylaminoacyl peptidase